ncbi:MAG: DUF1569 domain-containing protein [Bacteroidota bacterium]
MKEQLEEINAQIVNSELLNPKVSEADVGWHLDHSLKVIKSIYRALKASDPEQFKGEINAARVAVFISGKIPRGVGKAPRQVMPTDATSTEDLLTQLSEVKQLMIKFDLLPEKAFFKHPVFGNLDKKQTMRFIEIHTNHHLQIIRDIVK